MLTATVRVSPVFILTVVVLGFFLTKLVKTILIEKPIPTQNPNIPQRRQNPNESKPLTPYSNCYIKSPLLTKREWSQYHILKEIADSRELIICPKVRLLDLVVPRPGIRNYRGLKTRVMSKHVDFVICSPDMEVQAIIELDDTSHLRPDRIKRDQFVDSVLMGAGYRVIHTWNITTDILDFYGTPKHQEPELKVTINRTGPTYEEWKAAKLAEEQKKNQAQEAPAPGSDKQP